MTSRAIAMLHQQRASLDDEINTLRRLAESKAAEMQSIEEQIASICTHDWQIFKESCAYGERYTFCANCGLDNTTKVVMHYELIKKGKELENASGA